MNRLLNRTRRGLLAGAALLVILTAACSGEPSYCTHYDDWADAEAEIAKIERRNPSGNVKDWRAGDLDRWADAVDDQGAAAHRLWDAAPDSATWASVKRECR